MSTKIPIWLLKFRHFCHLVTQIDYPKFTKLCKKIYPKFFGIDILGKIIGLLAKPFMKRIYTKINYEEFGGALLLGVKGITVISHGRSKAYAIKNAVRVAKHAVETGVNEKIAKFYEE